MSVLNLLLVCGIVEEQSKSATAEAAVQPRRSQEQSDAQSGGGGAAGGERSGEVGSPAVAVRDGGGAAGPGDTEHGQRRRRQFRQV